MNQTSYQYPVALPVPVWGYDEQRHGRSVPDVGHCDGDTIQQLRELQQVFESVEGLMLLARMAEEKGGGHIAKKGKVVKDVCGRLMRWCPVKDCVFTTTRMRLHLRKRHKVTNDEWLNALLRESPLCGPSCRLSPSVPSSPSTLCQGAKRYLPPTQ